MNNLDWKARRKIAYKLYNGLFDDYNLQYKVIKDQTDDQLIDQVIDFFINGSELIYPAKYIFCNIIYSYYLNKYFSVDFYQALDNIDTLYDSPCPVLYHDRPHVYNSIISAIIDRIELLPSVNKTRHYFKMEMLIDDEDISDVCDRRFIAHQDPKDVNLHIP